MNLKEHEKLSTVKKERNSSLELLRILATLFVVVLHYNNKNSGKAFLYTEELALHYQILVGFEMLSICAVNIFVMISGYFMCNSRKVDVSKALRLYADVIFFSVFRYLLNCATGDNRFSVSSVLYFMIPLNWYVAVYTALFLISPYLNKIIRGMSAREFRTMLLVGVLVFSVWPSALEFVTAMNGMKLTSLSPISIQGSAAGYSIVNFVLMYFLGAYLRMHMAEHVSGKTAWAALAAYLGCSLLLIIYSRINFSGALSYCNPLVVFQSVAIFMVFQSLKIRSKAVNTIAGCSFGVYLLHSYFFKFARIQQYVTGNPLMIPVHVVVSAILIYGASAVVYWVYQKTFGRLFYRLLQKFSFISYEIA